MENEQSTVEVETVKSGKPKFRPHQQIKGINYDWLEDLVHGRLANLEKPRRMIKMTIHGMPFRFPDGYVGWIPRACQSACDMSSRWVIPTQDEVNLTKGEPLKKVQVQRFAFFELPEGESEITPEAQAKLVLADELREKDGALAKAHEAVEMAQNAMSSQQTENEELRKSLDSQVEENAKMRKEVEELKALITAKGQGKDEPISEEMIPASDGNEETSSENGTGPIVPNGSSAVEE